MFETQKGRASALFCFLLGVVLLVVAACADAQLRPDAPRIGVLTLATASSDPLLEGFRTGLRDAGYVEGQNIALEYRSAQGSIDRLPALATELVGLKVKVILVTDTAATLAAKRATQAIPIVAGIMGGDPVKLGIVASLNRPGGNVTGLLILNPELSAKRLQTFKNAVPGAKRLAVIYNSASPNAPDVLAETKSAAQPLDYALQFFGVRGPADLEPVFKAIVEARPHALITLGDGMLLANRAHIVEFAAKHRLPGIFPTREFADAGGLMTYGPNPSSNFRRAAGLVDQILKGAIPAQMPIEQPAKIELVINLRTAKALDLTIPSGVLALADDVIR